MIKVNCACIVLMWALLFSIPATPQEDPPKGSELFQTFLNKLEEMDSFYFESECHRKLGGKRFRGGTIRCYLQKPNKYRVECLDEGNQLMGLLVCDGTWCWATWPQGTSLFTQSYEWETEVYKKDKAYMGKSISHQLSILSPIGMPVFNANNFFGGKETVMEYLDDVQVIGEEKVQGTPCYVLKVEMMLGQRNRTIWLSKEDFIPRKWLEELALANPQSAHETWTNIKVNPELSDGHFVWIPPKGYEERRLPTVEQRILQVGDRAADFSLKGSKGETITLSNYKGKAVWLMFWRIG